MTISNCLLAPLFTNFKIIDFAYRKLIRKKGYILKNILSFSILSMIFSYQRNTVSITGQEPKRLLLLSQPSYHYTNISCNCRRVFIEFCCHVLISNRIQLLDKVCCAKIVFGKRFETNLNGLV